MTAVALARRVFLGGVTIAAVPAVKLVTPLPFGQTLRRCRHRARGKHRRARGWCSRHRNRRHAGPAAWCVPHSHDFRWLARRHRTDERIGASSAGAGMPLAPMLAAALAVNEAFLFFSGGTAFAGRRAVGLSLWNPAAAQDWLADVP